MPGWSRDATHLSTPLPLSHSPPLPPITTFALSSGRSGTHFLYELIRRNALDCVARHEPYLYNPSMFGRPIYDFAVGDRSYTRRLLARKQRIIHHCGAGHYLETSHAFLKSWFDLAPEYFSRLKLVHLIRDPLKVAKSEAIREELTHQFHFPFRHYKGGDHRKYFRWSLTGLEPIYQTLRTCQLTRFQWYLVQWIEIENRAMRFLDQFDKRGDCFSLHSPADLNDVERVQALLDFLGLKTLHKSLAITGRQNKNWRPTTITDDDRRQLSELLRAIPASYLSIFHREPYTAFPWISSLTIPAIL